MDVAVSILVLFGGVRHLLVVGYPGGLQGLHGDGGTWNSLLMRLASTALNYSTVSLRENSCRSCSQCEG